MGSATRNAVAAAKAALAARPESATLAVGEELLSAGRVIGDSAQLLSSLADPSADPAAKSELVGSVFRSLGSEARDLLTGLAGSRWSDQSDLLAGIEELGLRALASSSLASAAQGSDAGPGADIPAELFAFGRLVASNADLELAVGSKLGDPAAKAALVENLLKGRASEQTIAIVRHLVQQPRGRRIGALLRHAADIVADQSALTVATVTVAASLSADQLDRLRSGLAKKYGDLRINQVVDPSLIGGVRVAVGGEVIDDSVATRLKELRLQLAG